MSRTPGIPAAVTSVEDIPTPDGPARLRHVEAEGSRAVLLLAPGHSGQIHTRDLQALAAVLPGNGIDVVVYEPPFRVAGKKMGPRPPANDVAFIAAARSLSERSLSRRSGSPAAGRRLHLGGRSAGARSACRIAGEVGATSVIALAFPLHPPGRPERSRLPELLGAEAPVLVLQGERDPFGGPEEFPADTRLIPIPGADHGFRVAARAEPGQVAVLETIVIGVRDEIAGFDR